VDPRDAMDEDAPVFVISVAAELSGMHPQTLRQYDRLGLVSPTRTAGRSRRYSMRDIVQLREVARLGAEGVSLEGIALADELLSRPGRRVFAARGDGDVVSLRAGVRPSRPTEVVLYRAALSMPDADRDGSGRDAR
jgi:MerR family transcriptional regulator/heat shock protein HspR